MPLVAGDICVDGSVCYAKESLCFYPQFNHLVTLEVIAACHVGYIVLILGLRAFMKNRAAFEPKLLMTIYNVVQVLLSGAMTIGLWPFVIGGKLFYLDGEFCSSVEFWTLVHYLTKYLDMLDTVWMVLRKKDRQISFLHVYHHLTIGAIWGLLLHYGIGNGAAMYGAWINSLVHTLMYFHYFITSFGINNPLKKYLTQFQMLQFASCIAQAVLVNVRGDKHYPIKWGQLQLVYHATLLILFGSFYMKSIRSKKSKGGKGERDE